jgi:hypothetical protein
MNPLDVMSIFEQLQPYRQRLVGNSAFNEYFDGVHTLFLILISYDYIAMSFELPIFYDTLTAHSSIAFPALQAILTM